MDDIFSISEERIYELNIMFEKEINDFINGDIDKEEFIFIIRCKRVSFSDLVYLVRTYIGNVIFVDDPFDRIKSFELSSDEIYCKYSDDIYDCKNNINKYNFVNIKKIKKYESMKGKGFGNGRKRITYYKKTY